MKGNQELYLIHLKYKGKKKDLSRVFDELIYKKLKSQATIVKYSNVKL